MGSSTRNKTIYFLLFSVLLCVWFCGSNGTVDTFKIFRSERDIFTNLNCRDSRCTNSTQRCEMYNAECVNATCEYCRCLEGANTLMIIEDGERKCKRDEEIVPESVPQEAFSLKNDQFDQCLKSNDGSKYLTGVYCNKSLTSDMLWIWSNIEGEKQLINVKTLKCMERKGDNRAVTMEQCENNSTSQKILCTSKNDSKINIGWKNQEFLHFGKWEKKNYAISRKLMRWWCFWWCQKPQPWSSENTCKTSKVYKGCYRFSDGSFMKYLDYSQTTLTFSAPIFKEHGGKCKVKEIFKFIRDGQEWKSNGSDHFYTNSRSEDTKVLEIKSMENLKAWNGSLLILNISCRNEESEEVHCILFKLKSLPPYPGVFPTSNQIATHNYRSTRSEVPFTFPWIDSTPPITTLSRDSKFTKDQKTPTKRPSQSPTPTTYTTENPQESFDEETSKSRGTNSTVFAIAIPVTVTLLLVALALTLLYNRKRKRSVPSRNTGNPDELAEFTNPRQIENNSQSTANESQLYANDRTFALHPLSPEYEIPQCPTYDYPEIPQKHQYEYPSLGQPILKELAIQQETNTTGIYADAVGMDSGYTPLIRRPVNNDGDNGYTHLIDIRRKEKAGATEGSDKPDELPNAQLKNKCEDSSNINAHLINGEKDEAGELPYVVVIDSQYTALARPPLKNGESEDPGYEPLTKNRK